MGEITDGDHGYNPMTSPKAGNEEYLEGILVSKARGRTFTSLILAKLDATKLDDNDQSSGTGEPAEFILVRLRFPSTQNDQDENTAAKELRSFCRRYFKIGDRLKLIRKSLCDAETSHNDGSDTAMAQQTIRMIIDCPSVEIAKERVCVLASRQWSSKRCQQFQDRWNEGRQQSSTNAETRKRKLELKPKQTKDSNTTDDNGHGTGRAKRAQAELLATFLVDMIVLKLMRDEEPKNGTLEHTKTPENLLSSLSPLEARQWRARAIDYLNTGGGVCDVAGGSGHVSMALGMLGVKSTVIDPRERVGMLPGRDRKVWKRAIKQSDDNNNSSNSMLFCQPVVPFQTQRSWFGVAPEGVDSAFRHPDRQTVSVCDEDSSLVQNASAIVALHPDEATGEAVRVAVAKRIPFCVVPCCVFARLFPSRVLKTTQQSVGTYPELVCYLQEQDPSIRRHKFPFGGRNAALWSIF